MTTPRESSRRSDTTISPPPACDGLPADAGALERVFEECRGELFGLLVYLLGSRDDALDAMQEAFVKCWRRCDTIDQVRHLRPWVFRVALNTARDMRGEAWRRRRTTLGEKMAETAVSTTDDPQQTAQRREQLRLIAEKLTQLPLEQREVFLLRQNGQLTYAEIAATLDVPIGTVKTRMRNALRRLHEALAERDG